MTGPLSNRGQRLVDAPPLAEYIGEHFVRSVGRWHPTDAPDGYIGLCIAENKQVSDMLATRLHRVRPMPPEALGYDAMIGSLPFRQRLADFMGRAFLGRAVQPEQLAVVAGAGTVLEMLFYALCDPGDAVLVPTPSYAGFWADLETRDEVAIVPVHRHSHEDFRLSIEALDRARRDATRPVKALLFTSPDNPMGRVFAAEQVRAVLDWAEQAGIHVVFDEIYALSTFGTDPFVSAATLRPALGPRAHVVWAFSKDFGASGLRCGVLLSENEAVLQAVDGLAYWGACSSHTQHALGEIVADEAWIAQFVATMQGGLRSSYQQVSAALRRHGIEFVSAGAGFFVLCDLRAFLHEPTWQAEHDLWRRILDDANVNLTPGSACRVAEPGFFRLCYASEPAAAVQLGIERIARSLAA